MFVGLDVGSDVESFVGSYVGLDVGSDGKETEQNLFRVTFCVMWALLDMLAYQQIFQQLLSIFTPTEAGELLCISKEFGLCTISNFQLYSGVKGQECMDLIVAFLDSSHCY